MGVQLPHVLQDCDERLGLETFAGAILQTHGSGSTAKPARDRLGVETYNGRS